MREKKRPRNPSPERNKQASPDKQLDEFLRRGCCCASRCYQLFYREEYKKRRDEANSMSRDELDMLVLGNIMALASVDDVVGPSHKHTHQPSGRG